ncbi:MAG: hypothetical protein QXS27_03675 [Candidatus Jordarchaeaceae archaeon]
MDRGSWYKDVFQDLKLSYAHKTFGERGKVEAVLYSYKQRKQGLLLTTSTSTSEAR